MQADDREVHDLHAGDRIVQRKNLPVYRLCASENGAQIGIPREGLILCIHSWKVSGADSSHRYSSGGGSFNIREGRAGQIRFVRGLACSRNKSSEDKCSIEPRRHCRVASATTRQGTVSKNHINKTLTVYDTSDI